MADARASTAKVEAGFVNLRPIKKHRTRSIQLERSRSQRAAAAAVPLGGCSYHCAVELEPLLAPRNHDPVAVLDAAGEDEFRQGVLDRFLDDALERARTIGGLPTFVGEPVARARLELDGDLALLQKPRQPRDLDIDD